MSLRAQRVLAVALVLLAGALAYSPALDCGFLNLDDQQFIVENPWIPGGLTLESVTWAFTADAFGDSAYVDYWQPATLLSRLVDGALFGLDPAGHHFTSLLLHLANAVLLLLLLAAATGRLWLSAVVALIFATHPLHVSSVVWVSERKDVLSVFFSLISLALFARFAAAYREHLDRQDDQRPGGRVIRWYLLLAAGYALCLMSKPMTLPLPLVMLLVAVWPIRRSRRPGLGRLALCLAPLLLLSASAIFLYSRVRIVSTELERIGVQSLFSNAQRMAMSFAAYPVRLLYPVRLQHIYPGHPDEVTLWKVAGSLLLLGAISLVAAACARRRPFLAVGWLWYITSILPAATAFQTSAAADRFAYFPAIGLTVMVVWSAAEFSKGRWLTVRAVVAVAVVIALSLTTRAECRHWRDSVTLFSHLLELDAKHDLAHSSLGVALLEAGEQVRAVESLRAAVANRPDLAVHHFNLGLVLQWQGLPDQALLSFAQAVRLNPLDDLGYQGIGMVLLSKGRLGEAEAQYREAIRLNPGSVNARDNLGKLLWSKGRLDEAETQFREAIRLNPLYALAHSNLGMVLWGRGRLEEAEAQFREAIQRDPRCGPAHYNLGLFLGKKGRYDDAQQHFREAVKLDPGDKESRLRIEAILELQRREQQRRWSAEGVLVLMGLRAPEPTLEGCLLRPGREVAAVPPGRPVNRGEP